MDDHHRQDPLPPPRPVGLFNRTYLVRRRQQRLREQLARDRAANHRVPTWLLVVFLVLLVGGWVALITFT